MTEHVGCLEYDSHRSAHRFAGGRWICDVCGGAPGASRGLARANRRDPDAALISNQGNVGRRRAPTRSTARVFAGVTSASSQGIDAGGRP